MRYQHIHVPRFVKRITFKDVLFNGTYTIDPYQNCEFGCGYCDSSYDKTVFIKSNAVERFKEELPMMNKGRIIIGSVHDAYQPIEENTHLTRELLQIIREYDYPIHILTKSLLIKRDLDILTKIKDVLVTFTILTTDPTISKIFEKNAPSPSKRFDAIKELKKNGIKTGIALIPIIPYITEMNLDELLEKAYQYKVDHLIFKHLELKGDQKEKMYTLLEKIDPSLIARYELLYKDSYAPNEHYISTIYSEIKKKCQIKGIPSYSL